MLILKESNSTYLVEGYSRSELLDMLNKGTVVLSFRKVSNNRDRIMYATRDLNKIPSRFHPSGAGAPYNKPNVIPVFDLVKKAWRSFRVERVSKAEPRRVGFLTRIFRKRKYTQDREAQNQMQESFKGQTVIEAYEIMNRPSFKDTLKESSAPINEAFLAEGIFTDLKNAAVKKYEDQLKKIAKLMQHPEVKGISNYPSKVAALIKSFFKDAWQVIRHNAPDEVKVRMAKTFKRILEYLGLPGLAIFLPTTPPGSLAIILFLRWIENKTGIKLFPSDWTDCIKTFKKSLNEASGALGTGAAGKVDSKTFHGRAVSVLRAINARLGKAKIRNHGKVGNGTLYVMRSGSVGWVLLTASKEPVEKALDDIDSLMFVAELSQESEVEGVNSFQTYSVENPQIHPSFASQGIASKIYGQLSLDFNIMAADTQSRQGKALWNKMVRDKTFRFVYVYSEMGEEIEEEINGDAERFQELMAEGDSDIRFIGTSMKSSEF